MQKGKGGDGFVKVGDFGLAKIVNQTVTDASSNATPSSRGIIGTPEFMSPEQMQPEMGVDTRADLYRPARNDRISDAWRQNAIYRRFDAASDAKDNAHAGAAIDDQIGHPNGCRACDNARPRDRSQKASGLGRNMDVGA